MGCAASALHWELEVGNAVCTASDPCLSLFYTLSYPQTVASPSSHSLHLSHIFPSSTLVCTLSHLLPDRCNSYTNQSHIGPGSRLQLFHYFLRLHFTFTSLFFADFFTFSYQTLLSRNEYNKHNAFHSSSHVPRVLPSRRKRAKTGKGE